MNNQQLIWIVDDDTGILEVTQIVLEEAGKKTELIQNEKELHQKMNEGNFPHLILLDILMSGLDGRDVARMIKGNEKTKSIPIIMMSADTKIEEKVKQAQADDYIKKPFDIDDLITKINSWLNKKVVPT